MIPFNVPCATGTELQWVQQAISNGHISGNGPFGMKVQELLSAEFGFEDVFLTHSCTGALEMAAMLCQFQPGDEVILPSFTHVGTANAFERAGATLVFADSGPDHPNVDLASVIASISPRTRAIVLVHYAGIGCEMHAFAALAKHYGLLLIEDAAHSFGAKFDGKWLGSFGHMSAFSFHETKNITCGQGGMLVVNDKQYKGQAAIFWENGTNRAAFFRGEVDQYTWVGSGSCFTMSDLNAAYLYGQLLELKSILHQRILIWTRYQEALTPLATQGLFALPLTLSRRTGNGHIFYLKLDDKHTRDVFLLEMRKLGVLVVFHYVPLHSSPHFCPQYRGANLPHCVNWSDTIVRLPLFHNLTERLQDEIIHAVSDASKRL